MDLRSKCPQCNNVRIIEIVPSNVGNAIHFSKARYDSCGYGYGDDWKDIVS